MWQILETWELLIQKNRITLFWKSLHPILPHRLFLLLNPQGTWPYTSNTQPNTLNGMCLLCCPC
jgi:hypothetical protein